MLVSLVLPLAVVLGTGPGATRVDRRTCLQHVDPQKLTSVLACYEPEGRRWPDPGEPDWLSIDSLRQLDVSQFEADATDFQVESARVLGITNWHGRRLGRASVTYRGGACTITATESWVLEDGRWKRLDLRGYRGYVARPDADPFAAAAISEVWLTRDPFAIPALAALARLNELRGPAALQAAAPGSAHRSMAEVSRAAMAANPDDLESIGLAVREAPGFEAAQRAYQHLRPDACGWSDITRAFIRRFEDPRALARFARTLPRNEGAVMVAAEVRLRQLSASRGGAQGPVVQAAIAPPSPSIGWTSPAGRSAAAPSPGIGAASGHSARSLLVEKAVRASRQESPAPARVSARRN